MELQSHNDSLQTWDLSRQLSPMSKSSDSFVWTGHMTSLWSQTLTFKPKKEKFHNSQKGFISSDWIWLLKKRLECKSVKSKTSDMKYDCENELSVGEVAFWKQRTLHSLNSVFPTGFQPIVSFFSSSSIRWFNVQFVWILLSVTRLLQSQA